MSDPVDTDALRDLLVIGAPPLSAPAAGHDKWVGQVRLAGVAAADEVDRLRAKLDIVGAHDMHLRAVIENAPHDDDCACGTMMNVEEFYPCSCWKADAL